MKLATGKLKVRDGMNKEVEYTFTYEHLDTRADALEYAEKYRLNLASLVTDVLRTKARAQAYEQIIHTMRKPNYE